MFPRHGKNKEQAWKPNSPSVPTLAAFFCGADKRQAVQGSSSHHGHAVLTHPPASGGAPVPEPPGTRVPLFARHPRVSSPLPSPAACRHFHTDGSRGGACNENGLSHGPTARRTVLSFPATNVHIPHYRNNHSLFHQIYLRKAKRFYAGRYFHRRNHRFDIRQTEQ